MLCQVTIPKELETIKNIGVYFLELIKVDFILAQ
jgi:hypothetical protein